VKNRAGRDVEEAKKKGPTSEKTKVLVPRKREKEKKREGVPDANGKGTALDFTTKEKSDLFGTITTKKS